MQLYSPWQLYQINQEALPFWIKPWRVADRIAEVFLFSRDADDLGDWRGSEEMKRILLREGFFVARLHSISLQRIVVMRAMIYSPHEQNWLPASRADVYAV